MKFVNTTKNTIHLADIKRYIPYFDDSHVETIDLDHLRKSRTLQQMILNRRVHVVEFGDSRLERNLQRQMAKAKPEAAVEEAVPKESGIELEVKLQGHFYDYSGYAKVNRNLLGALHIAKVKMQAIPLKSANELNETEAKIIKMFERRLGDQAILIDSMIPTFAEGLPEEPCSKRILNTTIEAHGVPRQFVKIANKYDEVWVPSQFCKDILEATGVHVPVAVVPNSVDPRIYNDSVKPYEFFPFPKPFIFLSVFNWHLRKGYDVLLRAYIEEFSNKDDTTLILVTRDVTGSASIQQEIDEMVQKHAGGKMPPQIMRCGRAIPEYEMGRLYRAATCFVLPSRGEGFGLPYVEASMCGVPVIGTILSGQADFLTKENSLSIPVGSVRPLPVGAMKVHYWEGMPFGNLDETFHEALRRNMRAAYQDFSQAFKKNKMLKETIMQRYLPQQVAAVAKERLNRMWEKTKCLCV